MTDDEVKALEELSGAAPQGHIEPDIDTGQWTGKLYVGSDGDAVPMYDDVPEVVPLIRWMAVAANAAPALIAEVRRLRAAERLAEAVVAWNRREDIDDDSIGLAETIADELAAYCKAKG